MARSGRSGMSAIPAAIGRPSASSERVSLGRGHRLLVAPAQGGDGGMLSAAIYSEMTCDAAFASAWSVWRGHEAGSASSPPASPKLD
jgi:hypothetical protein